MKTIIYTAPVIEPITLAELKLHLRHDSGAFDEMPSLAFGSHAIANNYTTHIGFKIEVLGYVAFVIFTSGTNGATGTVDVKIQESDDNVTWSDVSNGAFTQVTTANDNTTYEKSYTGTKKYIRTVAKVLLAACDFGTSIIRNAATSTEDTLLTEHIQTARIKVEKMTRRQLLTATWDLFLNEFPDDEPITLPFGNLQTVTHIKYKKSDWASLADDVTLVEDTDYLVEVNGDQHGRIIVAYGKSWPSFTPYPSNPIVIRFICGWTTAALVPPDIKSAIKLICGDLYENREATMTQVQGNITDNKTVDRLLWPCRLWGDF